MRPPDIRLCLLVSTHSRPKAAARLSIRLAISIASFNTQPPEGGCDDLVHLASGGNPFQHTAARRRLQVPLRHVANILQFQHTAALELARTYGLVSTHSRPKAAARSSTGEESSLGCFNTQPPEGGCHIRPGVAVAGRRFNTQPPEGGCRFPQGEGGHGLRFQHTAARRRLLSRKMEPKWRSLFQHTAARRRLPTSLPLSADAARFQHTAARRRLRRAPRRPGRCLQVSTHSRPKAAASARSKRTQR